MTQAQITGGSVSYERSRKVADYENKKATITFNVGEGDDAKEVVKTALDVAIGYVHTALGVVEARQTFEQKVVEGKIEAPAAKRGRPKKEEASAPQAVATAASASDPADMGGEAQKSLTQIMTDNGLAEKTADPADIDPFSAAPQTISDQFVQETVNRKVSGSGNSIVPKIKELIGKYGVPHVSQLPQTVRQKFIQDVTAL